MTTSTTTDSLQEYLDFNLKTGEIRRISPNVHVLLIERLDGQWKVAPFSRSAAWEEEGDVLLPTHYPSVIKLNHGRIVHPLCLRRSKLVGTVSTKDMARLVDSAAGFEFDRAAEDDYPDLNGLDMANYRWEGQIQTFTSVKVDLPGLYSVQSTESPCWYFDAPSNHLLSQLSFKEAPPPSKPSAYHARFCYPEFSPSPKDPEANLLWDISDFGLAHGSYDALFIHTTTHLLLGSGVAQVTAYGANVAFCDWYTEASSDVKTPSDVAIIVCKGPKLS